MTAQHADSCPYIGSLQGVPEGERVQQTVNGIWDVCNLTDLRRNLKPSLFVASSHDGSKFDDCCDTVFGLTGISTSHDSHVVDFSLPNCGTYKELTADPADSENDDVGSVASPSGSDPDGHQRSDRIERDEKVFNVTAARLLDMGLSHASNVYVPWCHAEACGQPVRSVVGGNSTLTCHWAETEEEDGRGYVFQLFDRLIPHEAVYEWDFLIGSMEAQEVTEEMKEGVEAFILLDEDSEPEEGNRSVDTVSISS